MKIFFQSLAYCFIFFKSYFKEQKFLNLLKSNLPFSLFLPNLRNVCLLQVPCILFGMFRLFIFSVIIDVVKFKSTITLFVFYFFHFVLCFLFLFFLPPIELSDFSLVLQFNSTVGLLGLPLFYCDCSRICIVLFNLIESSFKYYTTLYISLGLKE